MKKSFVIFTIVICSSVFAFAQKYWENSNISGSFDKTKTYKVAILPVISNDAELSGEAGLLTLAYNEISINLTGVSKFTVINKQLVEEAVNTYKFSGGSLNTSDYSLIAAKANADLLVYCELSRDMNIVKKKEVSTVMAYIQLLDVKSDFTALYSGKARMLNPVSKQSEMEYAIRKALKKLTDYIK